MISLQLLGLPPTSNNAYFNNPGGGRTLSTIGRAYKTSTSAYLVRKFRREMMLFKKNVPYLLLVKFYFLHLENKGYPKNAESRYKKLDASNRVKLLEDALKDAGGIDDSQSLTLIALKAQGAPERTEVWVWDLEAEGTPFDDALRSLQAVQ